ncbi:MAG: zinc-ribbon domain-containing protein [Clostridia bacterium]|nr:zinc-ribbon domain-containing protein [Clostridia bacterium]
MKKIAAWGLAAALVLFILDWGVLGVKLPGGSYDVLPEAYIGAICFGVMLVCAVCRAFTNRCPHCGKIILSNGKYCPHCGREL